MALSCSVCSVCSVVSIGKGNVFTTESTESTEDKKRLSCSGCSVVSFYSRLVWVGLEMTALWLHRQGVLPFSLAMGRRYGMIIEKAIMANAPYQQ